MRAGWPALAAVALLLPRPAAAFCSYHGTLYATTTVPQEYRDARWVVRARVVSARNFRSDDADSWTLYRLAVRTRFKGRPPVRITLFTWRNSGGFYLDRGMRPDIGGDYLLFLNPLAADPALPAAARGATGVNYACGQSQRWRQVARADRRWLAAR